MKKEYILFIYLLLLSSFIRLYPQSTNMNYILTRTMTNESGTTYLDRIEYFSAIGKTGTIAKSFTPSQADLVISEYYDPYSRKTANFLPAPFPENNGNYIDFFRFIGVSQGFYSNNSPEESLTYEDSFLSRVVKKRTPGGNNNDAIYYEYISSKGTTGERMLPRFSIEGEGINCKLKKDGYYNDGTMFVVKTTDEDGNISYVVTDKQDKLVLSRQINNGENYDTYYVYDNWNNLCYVLSPEAATVLIASNTTWEDTNTSISNYGYVYKYDKRNRCIYKKLPGCDPIYYIYDKADRLIFTQDGEHRKAGKWVFTIPDAFDRVVLTGTCTNTLNYAADPLGSTLISASWAKTTNTYKGYTLSGITLGGAVVLSANYYDSYEFMGLNSTPAATDADFTYETLSEYGVRYNSSYKGLLTGTLTAQLQANGVVSSSYIHTVMYYDYKGQVIQKKSNSHLAGGIEKTYIAYNFTGMPVKRKHIHAATGKATQTEEYTHTYDHANRLTKLTHKLNTNAVVTLAEYTYDELGRMATHKNHGLASTNTTYAYNVRSWITGITGSLFTQNLYYNTGSGTPFYNGNISSMTWKAGTETTTRGYKFAYDGLDRLTAATYGEGTAISTNPNRFDEKVTQYDRNGNIKKLERRGKTSTTAYGVIDNLTFTHTGNQLLNVSDTAVDPTYAGNFNFVDGSKGTGTEYVWDKNGNLVQDYNKQIANISYNLLNLSSKLQFRYGHTAEYLYDASGNKRQVKHTTTNQNLTVGWGSFRDVTAAQKASEKVTDYCGNVIYENGVLSMIRTPEGYITLSGTTPTYHYYLRDHLGNNRVVMNQSGTVTQVNHYYPFGGVFGEGTATSTQPYKYNDKELDRTNGLDLYDYSARFMDAALGQFTTVDPLAEKYYSISPYAYVGNNPIKRTDPTGMDWWTTNNMDEIERVLTSLKAGENIDMKSFGEQWSHVTDQKLANGIGIFDDVSMGFTINGESWENVGYGLQDGISMFSVGMNSNLNFDYENPLHYIGPGLGLATLPMKLLKPVGALSSNKGSSILSYTLSKTAPIKMGKTGSKISYFLTGRHTTNLGRFIGRAAGPPAWLITASDAMYNFVGVPNMQQIKYNIEIGQNPLNGTLNPTTGEYYIPGTFGFK